MVFVQRPDGTTTAGFEANSLIELRSSAVLRESPVHLIAIDEAAGDFAIIDDAADGLFAQPLNELPPGWYAHLRIERNAF